MESNIPKETFNQYFESVAENIFGTVPVSDLSNSTASNSSSTSSLFFEPISDFVVENAIKSL